MDKHGSKSWLPWKRAFLALSLLVFIQSGVAFQNKCQRGPLNTLAPKMPGDGGFGILISGNNDKYVPGEVYTVRIQGHQSQYLMNKKFIGFMLVVESVSPVIHHYGAHSVGTFELSAGVLTMHSEGCPNAVTQTSNIVKNSIDVRWTAPPPGSGCLRFKATVTEQRDVWYMDDGELTRELCEDVQESDDMQAQVIGDCCACDEAKYEVTFEGLWSRQTHPKDFPTNEWLTHFSDIIGASHSNDYRVWQIGGLASDGVKQVAEWGSPRKLESELKRQSDHIRTIIKARGLWYPDLNMKTFAVFRVDNKHHLMSLISMLGPSPDWIVGVSALELCMNNCSWVEQKVLNLYPNDAGTDSGITYNSPNKPTIPRQRIRRITNAYPSDPKSPFYDSKGQTMKPIARLTVSRQRVYEKSCTETGIDDDDDDYYETSDEDSERPECATSEWSEFSSCSVSCGKGLRVRTRYYKIPMKADMMQCNRQLEAKEMCAASVPVCPGEHRESSYRRSDRYEQESDSICTTSDWSPWSSCSVSCGQGIRMRSRYYLNRMGRKRCNKELTQKQACVTDLYCDTKEEELDPSCAMTQWSNWSPCSVTCGKGIRMRSRMFLIPSADETSCGVKTIDKLICEGDRRDCTISKFEAKEICLLDKDVGPCRGYFPSWYYDSERRMCMQFIFGGCKGNRNNFQRYDECTRICEFAREQLHSASNDNNQPDSSSIGGDREISQQISFSGEEGDNFGEDFGGLTPENQLGPPVDCMVTPWSEFSPCSVTCGRGRQESRRMIKTEVQNGGKQCPRKLVRRKKCKLARCNKENRHKLQSKNHVFDPYSEYTSPIAPSSGDHRNPLHTEEEYDVVGFPSENENLDCVMGDWGPWSPCTQTCGSESLQQRARSIVVKARGSGTRCGTSLERRFCTLPPCPHRRG